MAKVSRIVTALLDEPPRRNALGNAVHRTFAPAVRYVVDYADDFKSEGWLQFDTDQDASYFGVWVNPRRLLTLEYAEGDWTLVACGGAGHYLAEVRELMLRYEPGFVAKAIGAGGTTAFRQDRSAFLDLSAAAVPTRPDRPHYDAPRTRTEAP